MFGCTILDDCVRIRGLHSKSSNPRFACAILGLLHKIRSEVCAVKSSNGPNPYFAHNIYMYVTICTLHAAYL